MKSFATVLPFTGLVFAQSLCGPRTVTKTEVERITVTVQATSSPASQAGAADHESKPTSSGRPTHCPHSDPSHPYTPHYPMPNGTYHSTATSAQNTAPVLSTLLSSTEPTGPSTLTLVVTPSPVADTPAPASSAAASSPAASSLTPTVPDTPPSDTVDKNAATVSGKATSYGGNLDGGNCMFSGYTLPSGIFGTAFSGQGWDASKCGVCVSVTGPSGKPIKAMIVDKCPECEPTHLDLFADAYTAVSNQSPGIVPISYSIVPCGITSPIVLKNKSGTSPYWFSMQVMNANVGVAKLEVSTDGGKTWQGTKRMDYNFFENASGFGTATVDVKVTSVNGGVVSVSGVKVASGAMTTASANFK